MTEEGSELRTLASGGALNLVGAVTAALLAAVLLAIVARTLGPGGAGVLASAIALFTILSNTTELGADTGLVRAIARYRALGQVDRIRAVVRIGLVPPLVAGVISAVTVEILAPWLAHLIYHGQNFVQAVRFIRLFAPFLSVGAASTVILTGSRGFGTMAPFVYIENIGKPVARVVLVVIAISLGFGELSVPLVWAIPVGVGFVVAWLWMRALIDQEERLAEVAAVVPNRALRIEFWRFALPRGFASVFEITVQQFDILMVAAIGTIGATGVYAAASRLATVGTFGLQAIRLAIAPQISGLLAEGRTDRAEHLYQTATWWLIAASWPLFLLLACFAPAVMGGLFSHRFASGQTALTILALSMLVNIGTGNVTVVLLMGGKSSWNLFNAAGAVVLNVGLNLILIPRYGIDGAAISWAIAIVFTNVAAVIQVSRFMRMGPFGPGYLKVSAGALACWGGLGLFFRAVMGDGALSLFSYVVVAGAVWLWLLWRWRSELRFGELKEALRPIRSAAKAGLRRFAIVTSDRRVDPDYLIIGAKRGGTTSLSEYLLAHPNVAPLFPRAQNIKGLYYFDNNYTKGPDWYRSHFPTRDRRDRMETRLGGPWIVGEATPYYLFHPAAPSRARDLVPQAKLIVLLRDPVDRAYSHYRERVRHGAESLGFAEAIAAEPARLAGEEDRILAEPGYRSREHEDHSYVAQGEYITGLKRWLEHFPRSQLLVLRSEDLYSEPGSTYDRVVDFLGLPPFRPGEFGLTNYHPGTPMDPSVEAMLVEHFDPWNRRLEEYLSMEMGWRRPR